MRSLAVADAVNLLLILAAMFLFWRLAYHHLAFDGFDAGWFSLVFYIGQGLFLFYLVAQGTALFPFGQRATKLIYAAGFTILAAALLANYQSYALMRVHIDPSLALLALEPGFLGDLTLEPSHLAFAALFLVLVFSAQFALVSLPWPRCRSARYALALRQTSVKFLIVAGFLSTWPLWSYGSLVNHAEAMRRVEGIPLFLPRRINVSLAPIFAKYGVHPQFPEGSRIGTVSTRPTTIEAEPFRAFHSELVLPSDLKAEHDWNVLVLAAESWRWDMFTPDVMPRLWEIAQRRAWISPAHYSTGNSTPESLYGLFSGQTPFYWFTSYRHRLNPIFFRVLKKLGYETNVVSSSNLGYRSIDRYILGDNIDSLVTLTEAPPQMRAGQPSSDGRIAPPAKNDGTRKDLWDLAVVEHYLDSLAQEGTAKRFDFLFFYSTHYKYSYPPEFERFRPVIEADFALFNFHLKMRQTELLNRYRNAAYYLDYLLARVLGELERTGELDKTIVVVTGDHGEEFFEKGRFGHSMALNDYQTRVPLLLFFPQQVRFDYTVTSHADVVPTLLGTLKTLPALDHLFTGKNLAEFVPEKDGAVTLSLMRRGVPTEFALVRKTGKLHFMHSGDEVHPLPSSSELHSPQRISRDLNFLSSLKKHFEKHRPATGRELAERPIH